MKIRWVLVIICLLLLPVLSCVRNKNKQNQQIEGQALSLIGTKVDLASLVFLNIAGDTVECTLDKPYKIIIYVDSAGCVPCRFKPFVVKPFVTEVIRKSTDRVSFVFIFNSGNEPVLKNFLEDYGFNFPFCIDNSVFHSQNGMPKNDLTNGLLLDGDNRIILTGDPVQNPKMRELYFRTICERFGIEQSPNSEQTPVERNCNFGIFSKNEPQQTTFVIRNPGYESLQVDTIYTSCECTTAEIDKCTIAPTDSAIVTVTYKADVVGKFVREVYVKIGENDTLVLSINGEAVE